MKDLGIKNPLHSEVPKAPDIVLPQAEVEVSESEKILILIWKIRFLRRLPRRESNS